MRQIFDSIPMPEGFIVDQDLVATGEDSFAVYWAKQQPSDVIAFYVREMPKAGWGFQSSQTLPAPSGVDKGGAGAAYSAIFIKGKGSGHCIRRRKL
jgi:hypothetical protein